jgi:hypothetical protein
MPDVEVDKSNAPSLLVLATEINGAHSDTLTAACSALMHARRAGDLLLEAKRQVAHGDWLPWLTPTARPYRPGPPRGTCASRSAGPSWPIKYVTASRIWESAVP